MKKINIKTIITTIVGFLACAAMELMLIILAVEPVWLDGVLNMLGILLGGLIICGVMVSAGYVFGRILERDKADEFIGQLREKHTAAMKKQAEEAAANYAADFAKSEKFYQLRDEQHIADISRLNALIVKMSEDMSHLGLQLPHNQELLAELGGADALDSDKETDDE